MKNTLIVLFAFLALFMPYSSAQEEKKVDAGIVDVANKNETIEVGAKIKKEIKEAIVEIYGKESADEIYERVLTIANNAIKNRPDEF